MKSKFTLILKCFDHCYIVLADRRFKATYTVGKVAGKRASHANLMMKITKGRVTDLIAEEVPRMYANCAQSEVQAQIPETIVNMLQLAYSATWDGTKTALAKLLKTIVTETPHHEATDDFMSKSLDEWLKLHTFIDAIVKHTVSSLLLVCLHGRSLVSSKVIWNQPMTGFDWRRFTLGRESLVKQDYCYLRVDIRRSQRKNLRIC